MKTVRSCCLLLVILTTISCQKVHFKDLFGKKDPDAKPAVVKSFDQLVCFSYHYENYAWVYTHYGWYLDSNGVVHSYDKTADIVKAQDGTISEEDLMDNLAQAGQSDLLADKKALFNQTRLIPAAMKGTLSESQPVMADAGISTLSAYYYNKKDHRYTVVLLEQRGDYFQKNESPEAAHQVSFLKTIGAKTSHFYWYDDF